MSACAHDRIQELKDALCAVVDKQRSVLLSGSMDLKIDVKYDRQGRLSRVMVFPEFEYRIRDYDGHVR